MFVVRKGFGFPGTNIAVIFYLLEETTFVAILKCFTARAVNSISKYSTDVILVWDSHFTKNKIY